MLSNMQLIYSIPSIKLSTPHSVNKCGLGPGCSLKWVGTQKQQLTALEMMGGGKLSSVEEKSYSIEFNRSTTDEELSKMWLKHVSKFKHI